MPFVVTETVRRGLLMAVMTGTLAQWRDAVKTGSDPSQEQNIRACYAKVLPSKPNLGGKVVVAFTVGKNGSVRKAAVARSTVKSRRVTDCVVRVVRGIKFPKPKGGPAMVRYPVTFKPTGE